MSFFERLFGKKREAPAVDPSGGNENIKASDSPPIQGPPNFVRSVELQKAYWTHNEEEQSQLESRGIEQLSWPERLRLHHLICLQRIKLGPENAAATDKCRQLVRQLIAPNSPYRRRPAMIWQGPMAQPGNDRKPDMQGEFLNPSLTHLGCLEIFRVDSANRPLEIDFVSFDQLSSVLFASPSLIRATKLFYDDGRDEIVLIPLLYGLTWSIGNDHERKGTLTRFVAHLQDENIGTVGNAGIGVGQQDLVIHKQDGGCSLFGLGSVAEISFPLDMRDPRFDEKARARGIDPDEVRNRTK